jgi:hypothetical protein
MSFLTFQIAVTGSGMDQLSESISSKASFLVTALLSENSACRNLEILQNKQKINALMI